MSDIYNRLMEAENPGKVIEFAKLLSDLPRQDFERLTTLIKLAVENDPHALDLLSEFGRGDIELQTMRGKLDQLRAQA